MMPSDGRAVQLLLPVGAVGRGHRVSGSESSTRSSASALRNRASLSGSSGEMPSTVYPAPSSPVRAAVKSHASVVQPGVMAAG